MGVPTQGICSNLVGASGRAWQTLPVPFAGRASLAQSVERFHGKEKVNSSILLGGSTSVGGAE